MDWNGLAIIAFAYHSYIICFYVTKMVAKSNNQNRLESHSMYSKEH